MEKSGVFKMERFWIFKVKKKKKKKGRKEGRGEGGNKPGNLQDDKAIDLQD